VNDDPKTPAELFALNYVATLADDDRVMLLRMFRSGFDMSSLIGSARAVQIRRALELAQVEAKRAELGRALDALPFGIGKKKI
jgi:hypothetical protein